jgi:hypothetical protein
LPGDALQPRIGIQTGSFIHEPNNCTVRAAVTNSVTNRGRRELPSNAACSGLVVEARESVTKRAARTQTRKLCATRAGIPYGSTDVRGWLRYCKLPPALGSPP